MKSRVSKKIVKSQLDSIYEELYSEFAEGLQKEVLASCFYILHRDFGFGEKRLNRLKTALELEYSMMETGVKGQKYDGKDILLYLKDDLGIDLDSSNLQ